MIQQEDGEAVPLWVSTLQLSASLTVAISDARTTASLSCGIWRIGIQDYEDIQR